LHLTVYCISHKILKFLTMKIKIISTLFMLWFIYKPVLTQEFNEVIKLDASDSSAWGQFGTASDISGNFAIVGACGENKDEAGNHPMDFAGAAYLFERDADGNWNEVQKLVASDRAIDDHFGFSVSISGNYVVVGAPYEDEDSLGENMLDAAGSVYIFKRDGYGNWNEVQKIVASDRAEEDFFGSSVDISGNYILVGAAQEDEDESGGNTLDFAGSSYVFERDENGHWSEIQKLVASDRAVRDFFGNSVSISGDYAVIGAFEEDEDTLGENTMNDAGSAYIFKHNESGHWDEVRKIVASNRNEDARFGYRVGIYDKYIIVSAPYGYNDKLLENTVFSVKSAFTGSAYIFECNEIGNWNEVQKIVASDRAEEDFFGSSVDISGNYALVGAYDEDEDASGENTLDLAGSAYVFERDENRNWSEVQKLVAPDRAENEKFGISVGISGNYAIIGNCSAVPTSNGSVYIFESCTQATSTDPDNILENGDFETCILSPWSIFNTDYLDVTANAVLVDGTCTLSGITLSANPQPWDVQLKQELSTNQIGKLLKDSVYLLTFDASAETENRPCRISFEQSVDPWANIMNESILLGTETESYSFEFVMSSIFTDMQLSLQVGLETSPVTFDNVRLVKKVGGSPTAIDQVKGNNVHLFPNPASEYVTVIAENGSTVKLYNSMGFLVRTGMPANNRVRFEVADLPAGVYIVEIAHEKSISVSRVFIR
jgi:hypothetical protein